MPSKPFMKTRFRVEQADHAGQDHWQGGNTYHEGAVCPTCRKPLLLLWDINCHDPLLQAASRGRLDSLLRLPLYFCWQCVNDLAYQIVSPQEIRVLETARPHQGTNIPYEPYPDRFERRPLALDPRVPQPIQRILDQWNMDADPYAQTLSPKEVAALEEFFGHPVTAVLCLFHHQFGGEPLNRWWGEERVSCPNQTCPQSWFGKLGLKKKGRRMKFLAGVLNDPRGGLPMVEPLDAETQENWNYFVGVGFNMCDKCMTVYGYNRSD